jgi:hypothetical protein
MGFFQQFHQFHLVLKYKKGTTNKFIDLLSKATNTKNNNSRSCFHMDPFSHKAHNEEYAEDEDLKRVYQQL